MQPQLNDGKPTGRLNGTQMEVELYVINTSGEKVICGTRWVEITDEQRQKIMASNNVVVSMGASTDAIEITRSMQTSVHDGRATFRVNGPAMKAVIGDARNVNSAGYYFDPEAIKKLFPEAVETRAEKLARIAALDAQLFKPLTGHLTEPLDPVVDNKSTTRAQVDALKPVREVRNLTLDSVNLTHEGFGIRGYGTIVTTDKGAALHAAAMHPDGIEPVTGTTTISSMTAKSSASPDHKPVRSFESLQAQSDLAARHPYAVPKPRLGEWVDAAGLNPDTMLKGLKEDAEPPAATAMTLSDYGVEDAKIAGTFPAFTVDAKNRVTAADRRVIQGERRAENSGGNVNYYSVRIDHPKRSERPAYTFEVEDLIQALRLTFHEGTILKSLIRSATERELGLRKEGNNAIRDAEKMVHSSKELLRALKLEKANT